MSAEEERRERAKTGMEPGILVIEMLGGLRVRSQGAVLAQYTPQQTGALLALLALNINRICTRETLLEAIWPNADAEAGRASLRQALYKLRQQLEPTPFTQGGLFLRTQTDIQLNPEVIITDVLTFEQALRRAAADPMERAFHLNQAVILYRDHLLPGFYQEVFTSERRRLMRTFQTALHDLTITHEQQGNLEEAIACARLAVGRFPQSMEPHLDLIRLYTLVGQPSEALREYREFRDLLQQEAGNTEGAEVRTLLTQYENAAQATLRLVPIVQPSPVISVSVPSPSLQSVATTTEQGAPSGEPSAGYTELVNRMRVVNGILICTVILLLSSLGLAFWRTGGSHSALPSQRPANDSPAPNFYQTIELGFTPPAMSLDVVHHRLYFPHAGALGVIEVGKNHFTVPIPPGNELSGVAVDREKNVVFIAHRRTNSISIWDMGAKKLSTHFLANGNDTGQIAFDSTTKQLYVLNVEPPGIKAFDKNGEVHTIPLPDRGPVRVVSDSRMHRVFVVCQESNRVEVLDTNTFQLTCAFDTDVAPVDLVVDNIHNRIFVTNSTSGTLDVIDGMTYARITTLTLNQRPHGMALDSRTDRLYICRYGDNSLDIINSVTLQVEQIVDLSGFQPDLICIDELDRRIYVLTSHQIWLGTLP